MSDGFAEGKMRRQYLIAAVAKVLHASVQPSALYLKRKDKCNILEVLRSEPHSWFLSNLLDKNYDFFL